MDIFAATSGFLAGAMTYWVALEFVKACAMENDEYPPSKGRNVEPLGVTPGFQGGSSRRVGEARRLLSAPIRLIAD